MINKFPLINVNEGFDFSKTIAISESKISSVSRLIGYDYARGNQFRLELDIKNKGFLLYDSRGRCLRMDVIYRNLSNAGLSKYNLLHKVKINSTPLFDFLSKKKESHKFLFLILERHNVISNRILARHGQWIN